VSGRPCIPLVAWCSAGIWLGAGIAERLWWRAGPPSLGFVAAGCLCVVVLAARREALWVSVVVACLGAGVATCALQLATWQHSARLLGAAGACDWVGRVVSDPREQEFGTTVAVRLESEPGRGALVRLAWPGDVPPELGQNVRFSAIMRTEEDLERARAQARYGVAATARPWIGVVEGWPQGPIGALRRWRAGASACIARGFPDEIGAVMRAIALGDRRGLAGSSAEGDFRVAGVSHIVAVSGLRLGLVCAAVAGLGRAVRLRIGSRHVLTMAAGLAFVELTGAPYSAIRAFAMVCAGIAAWAVGVRKDALGALGAGITLILMVDPRASFSFGFRLSVAAVASLLLLGGLGVAWAECMVARPFRPAVRTAAVTTTAQIATLPLLGSTF
jgi:competence protein ComEC